MAEYLVHGADLTAVADAIREKSGATDLLRFPGDFVSAVDGFKLGDDTMVQFIGGQLAELINSDVTLIKQSNLFYRCTALTHVELPNAEGECPEYGFYFTTNLNTCKVPKVTKVSASSFYGSGLINGDFSSVTTVDSGAFRSCTRLVRLDFPVLKTLSPYNNFMNCTSLTTLIMRGSEVVSLTSNSALSGTPINDGTGYIYVPGELISSYQSHSVWKNWADQFRAIEDYPDV